MDIVATTSWSQRAQSCLTDKPTLHCVASSAIPALKSSIPPSLENPSTLGSCFPSLMGSQRVNEGEQAELQLEYSPSYGEKVAFVCSGFLSLGHDVLAYLPIKELTNQALCKVYACSDSELGCLKSRQDMVLQSGFLQTLGQGVSEHSLKHNETWNVSQKRQTRTVRYLDIWAPANQTRNPNPT